MTTDQLIRAALAHAADQAPDPHRVHAQLAGRARTRRRRRTLLVAVAVASCLVVAAAAVTWWPRYVAQPATPPTPTCSAAVYLDQAITPEQTQRLEADLRRTSGVTAVVYESKEDAYRHFKEMFRDAPDLVNSVRPETLPASFRLTVTYPVGAAAIHAQYPGQPGVTDVRDQCYLVLLTPTR